MADGGGGTRWIKYGCLGCAGLAGIAVLLMAGVAGIAWMSTEPAEVEDRVLTHEVPPAAPPAEIAAGATRTPLPSGVGMVTLDLANAEFEVLPGDPGDALRVEASFDKNAYVMEETFENPEGERWHYTFRFRRKGSGLLAPLRQLFSGSEPDIRIFLPPDSPMGLDLAIAKGGCSVRLGGLWLTEADVSAHMGGLMLEFDEPLREPMERLNIDISMGGAAFQRFGNASPRELVVDISMGGMQLDLRGEWRNDSDITVSSNRGGGEMRLPRNALIEGLDASSRIPDDLDPEIKLPTLRFSPESNLKDIDVRQ